MKDSAAEHRQNFSRQRLTRLLASELSQYWLGDRRRVLSMVRKITGRRTRWTAQLAESIYVAYGSAGYATRSQLQSWLNRQKVIKLLFQEHETTPIKKGTVSLGGGDRWDVPIANNETQLCDLLCLRTPHVLVWLTRPHRRRTTVDHYFRHSVDSRSGGVRWIEQPRPVIKRVQRLIANEILSHIPLHDSAHAYRSGRSIRSCAAPHVGKRVVFKMDLENFFGSIPVRRVAALFRQAGYAHSIALTLAQICTVPAMEGDVVEDFFRRSRLPQGAPTSPAIANAIAYQMDRRIAGLCKSLDVTYTRYADDLIFSGGQDFALRTERFATTIAVIVMEEGFQVQYRKTKTMLSGSRQRVLGLNVNESLSTDRQQYETLKAILTNCARHGWISQNRENHPSFKEHLRGRIVYLHQTNPARHAKLKRLFESIDW